MSAPRWLRRTLDTVPVLVTLAVIVFLTRSTMNYVRAHDDMRKRIIELEEDNKRLAAANASINKLKTIALMAGSEPVTISGKMWVVIQQDGKKWE